MRYVIARNGVVENIVEWDGGSSWSPPDGTTAHPFPDGMVSIGWSWNNGSPVDPNPPDPVPEFVPETVTPLQLRRALRELGALDAILAYVASASDEVKEAWEYAVTIPRTDPLVSAGATALNLDVAAVFRLAATK